ncbi:2-oxoglutarate dehydrogenase complex dihydrolipoyllysine-residue succinyltransferase [Paenibacillus aurantius]|uniref:Dihydrolipoyllysine-residue succinyltransferase n=1 Tax=Paenibacillus aurantius TaxID=2918900 RepID=A0AA96RJJ5_9BACL|nr:2-oxoglutarate dehydrogenase complex dihydrolipoyllysine-residue succinyltransferase [Paenibacillus aurantius]WNQ13349.1 2-oxoglutarate dehydrogenase complex dihydrolipoyllysine-residue succinyltransferase [Paenibacillus aurantius]
MADVKVPEMGESITEGTITRWVVAKGDAVKSGDVLAEIETDKVNLEISAEEGGVLQEILRQEGETVQIGEVIARIGEHAAPSQSPAGEKAPGQEIQSERISGELAQVEKQPTAGAATAPQAPAPLPPATAVRNEGSRLEAEAGEAGEVDYVAPPSARKRAREQGVDLQELAAKEGIRRISPNAVSSYAEQKTSRPAPSAVPAPPALQGEEKGVERRRMSRRRATIAKRLVEAQHTAAMLTTFNEVDMTKILDIRKRRKQSFQEKHDVGLGFMSFFTKAVVGALKEFPLLNAEIQGEDILVKKFYDIGIAVSAKEGLVVPVVREADRLSFAEIERQIGELAGKARSNTLALSDLQGGTFTITNGGVFGSLLSTPILNTPQVGILGMHKIQLRPVAIDEERSENRPMMYIALSYDHRIVDGSEAVRFLVAVKEMLEDPETLLLEG